MQPWQNMTGKQICAMGKESFLARAPAFMGDILWEHLEILQKGTWLFFFSSLLFCILSSFATVILIVQDKRA